MEVLPDDPALLRARAAEVPQDPGIVGLVALCRAHDIPVEVVSDGLGFYVGSNLGGLGLRGRAGRDQSEPGRGRSRGSLVPVRSPDMPRVRHLQA